jgi:ASC-1-like (ASCH) protein
MEQKYKKIDIDAHWFELIRSGKKKVEGKKGSPSWIDIKKDDLVYFKSGNNTLFKTVKEIRKYTTIRSYLEQEGLRHTLPGVETIQEGIDIYMNWPISWTEKEVEKYGVLAIEFD